MTLLLGNTGTGTNTANSSSAGTDEAGQFTALATGTVDTVQFFFRTGNTAASVHFAIYADNAGSPGARIGAEQVLVSPTANADNAITGFSAPVVLGTSYWLAFLYPTGGAGAFNYADFAASGGNTKDATGGSNATLTDPAPVSWTSTFANVLRIYATGSTTATAGGAPRTFNPIPFVGGM